MIRRGSSWFGCVVPGCSWWWFSEPSLGDFFGLFSGPFCLGFDGGILWEPFVVLWAVIPLPNPWVKGLDFGVFRVLGLEVFLAGFLRFLLFGQVLVGLNLAMDSSWGAPNIPKVLFKSVERFGRSWFGFGGVDPQVLFIPSCLDYTGLTGATLSGFLLGWTYGCVRCCPVLQLFRVWVSLEVGWPVWPFGGFSAWTGLTVVKPLSGSCQLSPAGTGLTGGSHRSDRCWSVDSRFGVPLRSRVGRLCVGS
jgi:hypothetical protein